MPVEDFLRWFEHDELEDCPNCKEHTIVVTHTGAIICTECGYFGFRATAQPDLASE